MRIDMEVIDGVNVAVVRGDLTVTDMREAAAALWDYVKGPGLRALWDLRDARFDLSATEVQGLAEFIKSGSPAGDIRTAFVVGRDSEFGLVRMFEVFREAPNARTSVFQDRDAAFKWLTAYQAA